MDEIDGGDLVASSEPVPHVTVTLLPGAGAHISGHLSRGALRRGEVLGVLQAGVVSFTTHSPVTLRALADAAVALADRMDDAMTVIPA